MENDKNQYYKGRIWTGFSIGLLVGLTIAITFYFVDTYLFDDPVHLLNPVTESPVVVNDTTVNVVNNTYYKNNVVKDKRAQGIDSLATDSTLLETADNDLWENDDFFMDESDENADDIVDKDRGIANRIVKVSVLENSGDSVVEAPIPIFEVEQWSSSIKNKVAYQRKGNALKIKGLNIQNIKIIYHEKNYYVEYNNRYYSIRANNQFERLQPVAIN